MCYIVFLLDLRVLIKPMFFGALAAGVYGFLLIGKIYFGSDFIFKSCFHPTQLELGQGLIGVVLTILTSIIITIIFTL